MIMLPRSLTSLWSHAADAGITSRDNARMIRGVCRVILHRKIKSSLPLKAITLVIADIF